MSVKTKWQAARSWKKGLYIASGTVSAILASVIIYSLFSYTGKCGGFFTFLTAPRPCSPLEHFENTLTGFIVLYWWLIIAFVHLGIVIGLTIDNLYNAYKINK